MTEEEQGQYQFFRWPESMEMGLLPWEASSAALELMEVHRSVDPEKRLQEKSGRPLESRYTGWRRPSVRLARWFWHLTQAAPDLPVVSEESEFPPYMRLSGQYEIAVVLAKWEAGADAPQWLRDAIEWYLVSAPWRSPGRALEYAARVDRGQIPMLDWMVLLASEDWRLPNREDLREFLKNEIISSDVKSLFGKEDTDGEAQA